MLPGPGGGDSRAAHACRVGLQETLIIDQQIPNVNRAIRPENTDIHHPDTNYAAGPDVITGARLSAPSHPTLYLCTWLRAGLFPEEASHMPGSLWPHSSGLRLSSAALKTEDPPDPVLSWLEGHGQTPDNRSAQFWLQF